LSGDLLGYYGRGWERNRLRHEDGRPKLELARTLELLERFLPPPPADVLDVGGGPGAYAVELARRGYRVRLVDPVPLHVDETLRAAEEAGVAVRAEVGDARELAQAQTSVDAVVLLGPLYHLTERADRLQALSEARRVLRPDGAVAAVAISRFASLFEGLFNRYLAEPTFRELVERDLREGQHRNPDPEGRPEWFTTAFFHRPEELADEVAEAGLRLEALVGVEGPGWLLDEQPPPGLTDGDLLFAARAVEAEPSLAGLSAHVLALARA
jgi:ubiquinone/menaquinone biosynthesis C-methylase UbiE